MMARKMYYKNRRTGNTSLSGEDARFWYYHGDDVEVWYFSDVFEEWTCKPEWAP